MLGGEDLNLRSVLKVQLGNTYMGINPVGTTDYTLLIHAINISYDMANDTTMNNRLLVVQNIDFIDGIDADFGPLATRLKRRLARCTNKTVLKFRFSARAPDSDDVHGQLVHIGKINIKISTD